MRDTIPCQEDEVQKASRFWWYTCGGVRERSLLCFCPDLRWEDDARGTREEGKLGGRKLGELLRVEAGLS